MVKHPRPHTMAGQPYPPSRREGFSGTRIPVLRLLGNLASGTWGSRKPVFPRPGTVGARGHRGEHSVLWGSWRRQRPGGPGAIGAEGRARGVFHPMMFHRPTSEAAGYPAAVAAVPTRSNAKKRAREASTLFNIRTGPAGNSSWAHRGGGMVRSPQDPNLSRMLKMAPNMPG